MRRGARGCAATAMRTLRDFMTPALWLIFSTASVGRSRRCSRARARSGVRAGSEALATSSGGDTVDGAEASRAISDWDLSGFMGASGVQQQNQNQDQNQRQAGKSARSTQAEPTTRTRARSRASDKAYAERS